MKANVDNLKLINLNDLKGSIILAKRYKKNENIIYQQHFFLSIFLLLSAPDFNLNSFFFLSTLATTAFYVYFLYIFGWIFVSLRDSSSNAL